MISVALGETCSNFGFTWETPCSFLLPTFIFFLLNSGFKTKWINNVIVKGEGQLQFWHIFAHPGVLNKQNKCSLLIHVLLLVSRPFSALVTWYAPCWLSSYNAFWILLNPKALYKNKTIGLIFLMKRARHREVLQSDTTNKGGKRI